ncbi:MAG: septum formation initiator family protein [Deltaproteobacteria bacterium]|jgi:cell division protein FtsB|nr:septum formation initiator family protein [Deltaproteobacteria bacterium]
MPEKNPLESPEKGFWRTFWSKYFAPLPRRVVGAAVLLAVLFIILSIFATHDGLYRSSGLKIKKADLESENLRLEEENRQLESRLERFGQDPGFLEDEARRKLRLVRSGEVIYRLAEEPDLSDNEAAEQIR